MRHFAEHGYRGARVEDIANEVAVAKGTVFLDFSNKEGLFLAAYQRAVSSLPAWLDAPGEVVDEGFWATLDWWLERTEEFGRQDWVANRVALIGRYDTGLGLRRPIDRFMRSEDPYGTLEFVEFGVGRGEVRKRRRRRDALVDDGLAGRAIPGCAGLRGPRPGLIHRTPERRSMRIREFVEVLRGGIEDRHDE